jgi:hypothetical protein
MAFENMDNIEPGVEEAGPPPEESNNRTFLIVAGILGSIMLLSLLCLAVFAWQRVPQMRAANATALAEANLQSTAAEFAIQQTSAAQAVTPTATPTRTRVPDTPTPVRPTNTAVVLQFTNTPIGGVDPRTATVAALMTQAAAIQTTVPAVTATPLSTTSALPGTGFAEDVGAPGLLAMAVLLVGVIFLARRLRTA